MSSRRIASHANLVPIQEKTVEPFSTFNSDKVNKLTRIISNGDDGVTHGLEIKNTNDQIDSIRDFSIFASGNYYDQQAWSFDSTTCRVNLDNTNTYLQGFELHDITEACVKTITYSLQPSKCKFDFDKFIGKNVKLRFTFEFNINCGSPKRVIASVNNDSYHVDYPRYRTNNLKLTVVHNLINDEFYKNGKVKPLTLGLNFVLDPEDKNSCYKEGADQTCCNGQSNVTIQNLSIKCEILSHEEKIFDYSVIDGSALYDYPTTYVHPTHKLYITPGVAIKDDIVLDEQGLDINKNTPTMVLDLNDPNSWIKSNPYTYSDFYKEGAEQYGYVLNRNDNVIKLTGSVNTETNNLEFNYNGLKLTPVDDFETTSYDRTLDFEYNNDTQNEKLIVEFPELSINHLDNKDLYGSRCYAVSKYTGKIVKIFDLGYESETNTYPEQYVEFTYQDLVFNTNETLQDQIEFKISAGPIKVSGNVSEINKDMVKWANVVVYYTYFKHPEPNMSYIGLVRDEDLEDGLYGEDYLVLGKVRFISPNTVDLITYCNRQEFTWWSDKAQNIEYGHQIPLEIQKLWINPYGKLDIPNSVSDALTKLVKWIPEYFNQIRLANKIHKNIVDTDSDKSVFVADGKDVIAIEKENYNAERDASIDRAKIKLTKIGSVTTTTREVDGNTEEVTTFDDMPDKLMAYRKDTDTDYGLLPFLNNSTNYSHPEYMKRTSDGVYSVASNKDIHIKILNGNVKNGSNITPDHIYVNGTEVEFELLSGWFVFQTDCGGYYTLKIVKDGFLDYEVRTCTYSLDYSTVCLFDSIEGFNTILNWGLVPYDLDSHMYVYDMCNNQIQHAYYENKGGFDSTSTVHLVTDNFTVDINTDDRTSYGPEVTKITPSVSTYLNNVKYVFDVDNFNMRTSDECLSYNNIVQNAINLNGWDETVCTISDDHLKSIIGCLYSDFNAYLNDKGIQWNCLSRQEKEDLVYEVYNGHENIGRRSANIRAKVCVHFNNKIYEIVAPNNVEGKYWHVYQIINGEMFIINEINNKSSADVVITPTYNSDPNTETYDYSSDKLSRGLTILPTESVDWVLLKNVTGDKGVTKHNYSIGYYDEDNYYVECYYANTESVPFTFFDKQNQKVVRIFDVDYTLQRNELDCGYNAKYGALLHSDTSVYSETVSDSDSSTYVVPFIKNSNPKSDGNDNVLRKIKIREGVDGSVDLTGEKLVQLLDRIHNSLYTSEHPHKAGTIPMWTSGKYGAGYLQTCTMNRGGNTTDLTSEYLEELLDRIHDDTTTGFTHVEGGLVQWALKDGTKVGYQTTSKYNFDSDVTSSDWMYLPSWNEEYTKIIKGKYCMNIQSEGINSNTILSLFKNSDGKWCITNTIYTVDQSTTTITNSSATSIANTAQLHYLDETKLDNPTGGSEGQVVSYDKNTNVICDWIYSEELLIAQTQTEFDAVKSQTDVTGTLINTVKGEVYKYENGSWSDSPISLTMSDYLPRGRFCYNAVTNKFFYVDSNKNIVYLTRFLSQDGKDYNLNTSVENTTGNLAVWNSDLNVLQKSNYTVDDIFDQIEERHLMIGQLKFVARKTLKKYGEYDDDFNGWVYPDGRALSKTNFSEAFAVWGYTYGGSGELFNIPDLSDLVQVHHGGTTGSVTGDGTELLTNTLHGANGAFEYDSVSNTWNLVMNTGSDSEDVIKRNRIPTLIYIGHRNYETDSTYYTVNFLDYNGDTISSQLVMSGTAATAPTTMSRPGYKFTGWNTNNYIRVVQNLDVTAQYERCTYTVEFVDTVTNEVIATQSVLGGDNAELVAHPSHNGYTIPVDVDDRYEGEYTNVISDRQIKLLYVQQFYNVVFKLDDETVFKSYTNVAGGSDVSIPTAPVREGYTFDQWTNASKLTNIGEDVVCTAVYNITLCKVTFMDSISNTVLQIQRDIPYGSTVIPPDPVEHEDCSFSTWSIDLTSIKADSIAIAYYIYNAIIVKFFDGVSGESMCENLEVQPGSIDLTSIPSVAKTGYTFTGWESNRVNCFINTDDSGIPTAAYANHSVSFTAKYEMIRLTVKFKDHDGNVLDEQTIDYGKQATAPEAPVLDGYQFLDWVCSDSISSLSNITTDCTFTATYDTPDVDFVTITYHQNYED